MEPCGGVSSESGGSRAKWRHVEVVWLCSRSVAVLESYTLQCVAASPTLFQHHRVQAGVSVGLRDFLLEWGQGWV